MKALGVAGHRYAWFVAEALNPKARDYMRAFGGEGQRKLTARGLLGLGEHPPVSTRTLSLLDKIMGAGIWRKGAIYVREADFEALKMPEKQRDKLLTELGFVKMPAETFPAMPKTEHAAEAVAETTTEEAETGEDQLDLFAVAAAPAETPAEAQTGSQTEGTHRLAAEIVRAAPAPAETSAEAAAQAAGGDGWSGPTPEIRQKKIRAEGRSETARTQTGRRTRPGKTRPRPARTGQALRQPLFAVRRAGFR